MKIAMIQQISPGSHDFNKSTKHTVSIRVPNEMLDRVDQTKIPEGFKLVERESGWWFEARYSVNFDDVCKNMPPEDLKQFAKKAWNVDNQNAIRRELEQLVGLSKPSKTENRILTRKAHDLVIRGICKNLKEAQQLLGI